MKDENILLEVLFLILSKSIKIIVLVPLLSCSLTIFYLITMVDPSYISYAKILSSSNEHGGANLLDMARQFGVDVSSNQNNKEYIYPELVKSRKIAKSMLARKFQSESYGGNFILLQIMAGDVNRKNFSAEDKYIGLINFINLIHLQKNGKIYQIGVKSSEPRLSRDLTSALIEELDRHQTENNISQIKKTKIFIEDRLTVVLDELTKKENLKILGKKQKNRKLTITSIE